MKGHRPIAATGGDRAHHVVGEDDDGAGGPAGPGIEPCGEAREEPVAHQPADHRRFRVDVLNMIKEAGPRALGRREADQTVDDRRQRRGPDDVEPVPGCVGKGLGEEQHRVGAAAQPSPGFAGQWRADDAHAPRMFSRRQVLRRAGPIGWLGGIDDDAVTAGGKMLGQASQHRAEWRRVGPVVPIDDEDLHRVPSSSASVQPSRGSMPVQRCMSRAVPRMRPTVRAAVSVIR